MASCLFAVVEKKKRKDIIRWTFFFEHSGRLSEVTVRHGKLQDGFQTSTTIISNVAEENWLAGYVGTSYLACFRLSLSLTRTKTRPIQFPGPTFPANLDNKQSSLGAFMDITSCLIVDVIPDHVCASSQKRAWVRTPRPLVWDTEIETETQGVVCQQGPNLPPS